MGARPFLGAVGVLLASYGLLLLLTRQDPGQWLEVGLWLAAGVVAHDLALSAMVVGIWAAAHRLLPEPWRTPAAVAMVVWGALTVVFVPVLTRAGARADNPTLLDRPYLATWWTISGIVVLLVALAGFVRSRRPDAER